MGVTCTVTQPGGRAKGASASSLAKSLRKYNPKYKCFNMFLTLSISSEAEGAGQLTFFNLL